MVLRIISSSWSGMICLIWLLAVRDFTVCANSVGRVLSIASHFYESKKLNGKSIF